MLPSFSESSRIVSPPVSTRLEMFNSSKLSNIFSLCEKNFRLSEFHMLPIFWLQVDVRSIADKVEDHVDNIDEEERGKQPQVHSVQVQLRWFHRLLVPFAHHERVYHFWASKRRVLIAPQMIPSVTPPTYLCLAGQWWECHFEVQRDFFSSVLFHDFTVLTL